MLHLQQLYSDIEQLLKQKERIFVAIDGMSAAGKSSFANQLVNWFAALAAKQAASIVTKKYPCNLIHMDHFFLRPEQRSPERLAIPGGNIDYERFNIEVAIPLASGESFTYRPFNCKTQGFEEPVLVDVKPLTIIEGVYCMHPEIVKVCTYDITIFMQLDKDEQHRRLKKRNPELYKRFIDEWIPMERLYFETFDVAGKCDYCLDYRAIL